VTRYALDIETLDIDACAVVLSAALVNIDDPEDTLVVVFDPRSQPGRTIYPDTVMWWFTQPDHVRAAVAKPTHTLAAGLADLRRKCEGAEVYQWGTMDADILNHAYRQCFPGGPHDTYVVHYRAVRDARSIFAALGAGRPAPSDHTALGDARQLAEAFRRAFPAPAGA